MRYFVGFLITIGLIILLIILLAGGGGNNNKVPKSNRPLSSYATTDAAVIMTVDGPVNAPQIHNQLRITVTKDQITYERIRGYDNAVQDTRAYGNTENSYTAFLKSLSFAGFTRGDNSKELADERGYCPTGNRYIFELEQNGSDIQRYWTTTCNKTKTYLGSRPLTVSLFTAQVPDFNKLNDFINL